MPTTLSDTSTRQKVEQLLNGLCNGLYEREQAIKLALLSAIAGESIFLLGPPGVGKSLIARRLKYAFRDGTSFEYLMSKFSTPDEIFGPVSIKKLKEEDRYERQTENYLPSANIVFLDEIWKAGPAIQNALLTILNEKIYRNGGADYKVNIRGIITASNELPPASSSLDPIWDRFLIRLEMGNIRQFKNFLNMITDTKDVYEDDVPDTVKITEAHLDDWSERITAIEVPAEVLNTIQVVKIKIDEHNSRAIGADRLIDVHDRRWKKIVRLLRTSAFLNGRQKVDLMDCFLMVHCLWSQPHQLDKIKEIVTEAIRRHGYTMAVNLQMIKRETTEFENDVDQEIRVRHVVTEQQLQPIKDEYFELVKDDDKFDGVLISVKQFNQLMLNNPQVTNFYDQNFNLVNRLKAQKSSKQFTIEVFYNSERHSYPLRTRKAERTETITKKPHPVVQQHWDLRHQQLTTYIAQQEEKIKAQAPDELNHLDDNLFVSKDHSEVVKRNLEEVKEALEQLKLRLEKVQYAYTNI